MQEGFVNTMEHNRVCAQYCLDVIRAVMQEQPVPAKPEGVSLEELYAFSRMHSLEALVFHGISQLTSGEEDALWQSWNNRAQMLLTQSIVQLAERDALIAVLNDAGMEILPVKGCWLKECYPQIDFRQMADLDILIHREDREHAREIMLELGYQEDTGERSPHHDGYQKKPYMAVELHLQLLPSRNAHSSYYHNIWDKANAVEGQPLMKRLSAEDEYIFYFLHMQKHMEDAGCGIRSVLDCVVFRNAYPDMDRAYLKQELQSLGVWEYAAQVEELSDCWFQTGRPIPDALIPMAESVLWAGTYGNLEDWFQRRMDQLKKKYKNPVVLQIAYWSSRFFRPMEEMKFNYPVLEKLPFLLPVMWVVRIVKKCIRKPQALLHHVKKIYHEGNKHD